MCDCKPDNNFSNLFSRSSGFYTRTGCTRSDQKGYWSLSTTHKGRNRERNRVKKGKKDVKMEAIFAVMNFRSSHTWFSYSHNSRKKDGEKEQLTLRTLILFSNETEHGSNLRLISSRKGAVVNQQENPNRKSLKVMDDICSLPLAHTLLCE